MSEEKTMLLLLKGAMSELSKEDQDKAAELITEMNDVIVKAGELGPIVLGIAGLEFNINNP